MHSQAHNDDLLWQRCVSDDQKAFDLLFTTHFHPLCQYASRFNLTTGMVEEVVSDVFILLWLKRKDLKIHSLKPYLYTATRNTALNLIRKNVAPLCNLEDVPAELSDAAHNADTLLRLEETEQEIERVVDLLPQQQREVFRLRRIKGYSIEEISLEMNLSTKTVSNHLTQASRFITTNLKPTAYLALLLLNI